MQHTYANVHGHVRVLVAQGTTHGLFSQQSASESNFLCDQIIKHSKPTGTHKRKDKKIK
jgi:hypothetical protein